MVALLVGIKQEFKTIEGRRQTWTAALPQMKMKNQKLDCGHTDDSASLSYVARYEKGVTAETDTDGAELKVIQVRNKRLDK